MKQNRIFVRFLIPILVGSIVHSPVWGMSEECRLLVGRIAHLVLKGPGDGWVYVEHLPPDVVHTGYNVCSKKKCDKKGDTLGPVGQPCVKCETKLGEKGAFVPTHDGRQVVHKNELPVKDSTKSESARPQKRASKKQETEKTSEAKKKLSEREKAIQWFINRYGDGQKSLSEPTQKKVRIENPIQKRKEKRRILWIAGSGVALVTIIGVLSWGFTAIHIPAVATDMGWKWEITVQEFTKVERYDWCQNLSESPSVMPRKGKGEYSGVENKFFVRKKYSHTEKRYVRTDIQTKTEYVEKTKSVPIGKGKFKTVKYKEPVTTKKKVKIYEDVKIYRRWCSYDTYEWQTVRTFERTGGNPDTDPPVVDVELGGLEKAVVKDSYWVEFEYEWDEGEILTHRHNFSGRDEWNSWRPSKPAVLIYRQFGYFSSVRHPANE